MIIRLFLKRLDGNEYKRYKINKRMCFYRPYNNIYVIDGNVFNEEKMLKKLIKNLKTNVKQK